MVSFRFRIVSGAGGIDGGMIPFAAVAGGAGGWMEGSCPAIGTTEPCIASTEVSFGCNNVVDNFDSSNLSYPDIQVEDASLLGILTPGLVASSMGVG